MRPPATLDIHARQRGAALLILFAIISLGAIFALVAGLNRSATALAAERAQKTTVALAQAKEALIAHAVTYKDRNDDPNAMPPVYTVPGYLPCPDLGSSVDEGVAALNCPQSGPSSLVSVIGRLPWRTLGIDALKDGSGECLWYAVSGTYKTNPNGVSGSTNSNMMNWDTIGQLVVMDPDGSTYLAGATADANAVAVIFAPGKALTPAGTSAKQDRTQVSGTAACGGNYTASAYLETARSINNSAVSATARAQSTFIAGTSSDTFNDRLVYITRADIWNAIKKRSDFNNYLRAMTRRAAECTAMYGAYNGGHASDMRLPWATRTSLSTTSVSAYAVNANYNDSSGTRSGRLSFKVNTSVGATDNDLSTSIADYGTNSAYLFTNSSYCSYAPEQKIWYDNWKDNLFYAVAKNYDPNSQNAPMAACTSSTCLKINGAGSYAAVVIFAGDKLADAAGQLIQPRNLATDKGTIAYYLEGSNPGSITANTGGGNYQSAAASSSFNDIVYAIDTALAVKCYSGSGLGMVTVPVETVAPPGDPMAYAACP